MIRDRSVVGIRDFKLSERLQLDPDLMLAKTIMLIRQHEETVSRKKQSLLRQRENPEQKGINVDAISALRKTIQSYQQKTGHMDKLAQQEKTYQ